MINLSQNGEQMVADTLKQHVSSIRLAEPDVWTFKLPGKASPTGTVRWDHNWLLFNLPLKPKGRRARFLPLSIGSRLLSLNGSLCGGAKFALSLEPLRLSLSAEIPLDDFAEPTELQRILPPTLDGLRRGIRLWERMQPPSRDNPGGTEPANVRAANTDPSAQEIGEKSLDTLKHCCQEFGWPFLERSSGRLAVQLDVSDAFCQALIEPQNSTGVRTYVEMETAKELSAASREAIHVLLLVTSQVVRMARAVCQTVDGHMTYGCEVAFANCPTPTDFHHALSALSIACRTSRREMDVLHDETIAKEYLTVQGFDLDSCDSVTQKGDCDDCRT